MLHVCPWLLCVPPVSCSRRMNVCMARRSEAATSYRPDIGFATPDGLPAQGLAHVAEVIASPLIISMANTVPTTAPSASSSSLTEVCPQ